MIPKNKCLGLLVKFYFFSASVSYCQDSLQNQVIIYKLQDTTMSVDKFQDPETIVNIETETLANELFSFLKNLNENIDGFFKKEKADRTYGLLNYLRIDLEEYLELREKYLKLFKVIFSIRVHDEVG